MKTFEEAIESVLLEKLNESELPGEFEGMYFQKGKDFYQVKKASNRFFYYSRMQARWLPVKKDDVKYTDLTWEKLAKEIEAGK